MSDFTTVHHKSRTKHSTERPYCSTCRKANKSFAEYTSHWTKSSPGPEGTVICPIILNTLCTRCNKKGHWAKYCKEKYIITDTDTDTDTENKNIEENVNDTTSYFRPNSPDYPPPDYLPPDYPPPDYPLTLEKKISYSDIVSKTPVTNIVENIDLPVTDLLDKVPFQHYNISTRQIDHDWSDDDYWNE